MRFAEKSCTECGEKYTPVGGRQQKCSACRPAEHRSCSECGTEFIPSRHTSSRCEDCIVAGNPRAVQCPFPSCLAVYVPDSRRPHECRKGKARTDRLALVHEAPVPAVREGPSVPLSARLCARNGSAVELEPETLHEAQEWDRRKATHLRSGMDEDEAARAAWIDEVA